MDKRLRVSDVDWSKSVEGEKYWSLVLQRLGDLEIDGMWAFSRDNCMARYVADRFVWIQKTGYLNAGAPLFFDTTEDFVDRMVSDLGWGRHLSFSDKGFDLSISYGRVRSFHAPDRAGVFGGAMDYFMGFTKQFYLPDVTGVPVYPF